MTENQFWWATVNGNDRPEVVEVTFDDGKPRQVDLVGTDNYICPCDFDRCQVRLIERVLPAGRAAAVADMIEEIWPFQDHPGAAATIREAVDILRDGGNRA